MAKGIAEDSEGHISHPRPRALMLLRRGGPLGRFWGLGLMTTAEKKKANIKAKRLDFRSPKPQASMLVASGRGRRRRAGEATDGCRHCLEPVSETRETVSSAGQCTRNRPAWGSRLGVQALYINSPWAPHCSAPPPVPSLEVPT